MNENYLDIFIKMTKSHNKITQILTKTKIKNHSKYEYNL